MLPPLVTWLTFYHQQIYGFYFVFLAAGKLPLSQATFWRDTEPQGLWPKQADLDFWKSIDLDLPVNLLPDIKDVLLADEPAADYLHAQESLSTQFSQHQTLSSPTGEIVNLAADRLVRSSSQSHALLGNHRRPGHQEGFIENHTSHLDFGQDQIPQAHIPLHIGVLDVDQCQSLFSTFESYHEAGEPWQFEPLTDLKHWTSDLSPTAHNAWDSSEHALPQSLPLNQISGGSHTPSPQNVPNHGSLVAVNETPDGLKECESNRPQFSIPESRVYCSPNSSQDLQRIDGGAKESGVQPSPESPDVPFKPYHEVDTLFLRKSKRLRFFDESEGRVEKAWSLNDLERNPSSSQVAWVEDGPSVKTILPASTEALMQMVADNRKKILDPGVYGYMASLKSFLGLLHSSTVRSKSSFPGLLWVKETDAQKFFLDWNQAKIPYPPPFEKENVRRKHVHSCFEEISSVELGDQGLLKSIERFAKNSCEEIHSRISSHKGISFAIKMVITHHKNSFIDKIEVASKGTLFLVKAINSIFSEEEERFMTTTDQVLEVWRFLKIFFRDLSIFQSDAKQKYSWLKNSSEPLDFDNINRILDSIESNLSRSHEIQDYVHLSWLLTEVWMSENRPTLYNNIRQKGGKIHAKLKAIIYKFIIYTTT